MTASYSLIGTFMKFVTIRCTKKDVSVNENCHSFAKTFHLSSNESNQTNIQIIVELVCARAMRAVSPWLCMRALAYNRTRPVSDS